MGKTVTNKICVPGAILEIILEKVYFFLVLSSINIMASQLIELKNI